MGKPGAKKGDQIVSVTPGDVHIIMIPSPGGPVPTPIPHPCASMIKDKVAGKVKVMGQPGAVKGSISKHTPPHIPMGPGPFQKPPANKGEIVTASSNVFYEGKEAAMLGDTAKMCTDPSDTPVGKVIGTAAMVLVGGGGAGSDEARAAAAAAAMKAASAACHKWINANMPPGAHREQAHRDVCKATGHPIDVATGKTRTLLTPVNLWELGVSRLGVFPEMQSFGLRLFLRWRELHARHRFDVVFDNQSLSWGLLGLRATHRGVTVPRHLLCFVQCDGPGRLRAGR